jgi:hypothetical protein
MSVTVVNLLQFSVGGRIHCLSENVNRVDASDVLVASIRHDEDLNSKRRISIRTAIEVEGGHTHVQTYVQRLDPLELDQPQVDLLPLLPALDFPLLSPWLILRLVKPKTRPVDKKLDPLRCLSLLDAFRRGPNDDRSKSSGLQEGEGDEELSVGVRLEVGARGGGGAEYRAKGMGGRFVEAL